MTLPDLVFLGFVIFIGLYILFRYLKEKAELPKYNVSPESGKQRTKISENRA